MDLIEAYIHAFNGCYPQKKCVVKPKRVRGEILFRVVIDEESSDRLLNEQDMREATRLFNRGKA